MSLCHHCTPNPIAISLETLLVWPCKALWMSRFAYGSLANGPLQEVVRLMSRAETWAGRFDGVCCPQALCIFREHGFVLKSAARTDPSKWLSNASS